MAPVSEFFCGSRQCWRYVIESKIHTLIAATHIDWCASSSFTYLYWWPSFCSPTRWSQHCYRVPIDYWRYIRFIVPTRIANLVRTIQKTVQTARRLVGNSKNPRRHLIAYGLNQCVYQSTIPWADRFAKINLSLPGSRNTDDDFEDRRFDRLCPRCQQEAQAQQPQQ